MHKLLNLSTSGAFVKAREGNMGLEPALLRIHAKLNEASVQFLMETFKRFER